MRYEESEEQAIEEITKWKYWDKFLESRSNSGFGQSSWYASSSGWKNFGTVLKDGETIVGGAVVFRRTFGPDKCYYYMPDGPVLLESDPISDQKQAFDAILEFIERERQDEQRVVSHLCIDPRWERVPGFVTGFRESKYFYGLPRDTQCIDLDSSEDDILAQMKPKGRYNVHVARRHGVSVLEDVSSQGIADFLNIYEETFAQETAREASRLLPYPDLDAFGFGPRFGILRRVPRHEARNSACCLLRGHGDLFLRRLTCDSSECHGAVSVAFRDHAKGESSRLPIL